MASISTDSNGNRRILFTIGKGNGCRKKIHMGCAPLRVVDEVKRRVELLLTALEYKTTPDRETAEWAGGLEPKLYDRLAKFGLLPRRAAPEQAALGPFIAGYMAMRTDIKPATIRNLGLTQGKLVGFFGSQKPLADVTEGEADEFRMMLKKSLAENTVRRICGRARQFFHAAVKRRLIASNPFGEMKGINVMANKAREYYLSRADAQKVIDACPDAEWWLIFALSRYAGLRCPSEHLALRWGDVDWLLGRFTVHSSKTEHFEGKGSRVVPIFPELRPHLEAVWDLAEPGTEFVIIRYRNRNNANMWRPFEQIVRKAGLTPWEKLFQNLRSTRQTELAERFPAHVVCAWLGNSEAVAKKHYLQVTDEHFETAQKTAQQPSEIVGDGRREKPATDVIAENCSFEPTCTHVQNVPSGTKQWRRQAAAATTGGAVQSPLAAGRSAPSAKRGKARRTVSKHGEQNAWVSKNSLNEALLA